MEHRYEVYLWRTSDRVFFEIKGKEKNMFCDIAKLLYDMEYCKSGIRVEGVILGEGNVVFLVKLVGSACIADLRISGSIDVNVNRLGGIAASAVFDHDNSSAVFSNCTTSGASRSIGQTSNWMFADDRLPFLCQIATLYQNAKRKIIDGAVDYFTNLRGEGN